MTLPFADRLRLPVVAAPMFLVSGVELVVAACRAGVVGAFPAPNARTIGDLADWCERIDAAVGDADAPWALGVISHRTYERLPAEIEVIARYRPPLVITALGTSDAVLDAVHAYGGMVLADVASARHAERAVDAGADGLVLVCAGAGGHTGSLNPLAFVREVRRSWEGPLVVAGSVCDGHALAAVEVLGADLAYVGTRFIATRESLAAPRYRDMLVAARAADVVTSDRLTGVNANWLRASLDAVPAGAPAAAVDFTRAVAPSKAWKDVWSAGHGVGAVTCVTTVAELVDELAAEYGTSRELAFAHERSAGC